LTQLLLQTRVHGKDVNVALGEHLSQVPDQRQNDESLSTTSWNDAHLAFDVRFHQSGADVDLVDLLLESLFGEVILQSLLNFVENLKILVKRLTLGCFEQSPDFHLNLVVVDFEVLPVLHERKMVFEGVFQLELHFLEVSLNFAHFSELQGKNEIAVLTDMNLV
jgi:hypothetical protein